MYRYVPFDEIEKNKWNGTVHYAPNGNVYGYYWYMKSVYKQWDAIVEEDYQSVLPILPRSKAEIYRLTPQLGPYSVNPLSPKRTGAMIDLMLQHADNNYYPANLKSSYQAYTSEKDVAIPYQRLELIDAYEALRDGYSSEAIDLIEQAQSGALRFDSSIKPEKIVAAATHLSEDEKNAYLRIMYNAMHRGIGWSQGITDKETGKYIALSYFVVSHNVVHEILSLADTPAKYRFLLYDMSIKNSAGKPSTLETYLPDAATTGLGFTAGTYPMLKIGKGKLDQFLGFLGKAT